MLNKRNISIVIIVSYLLFSKGASARQEKPIWIAGWQTTHQLSTARAGAAVVKSGRNIYVIGGVDGTRFLRSVEQTRIDESGDIEPWRVSQALNEARGFFAATSYRRYLYVVSGGNGPSGHNLLRSIERARILENGELGPWRTSHSTLNIPRRCVKVEVINDRLYAFGGFGGSLLDTIESAPIRLDGSLGEWRIEINKFKLPRYVHTMKKTPKMIFAIGGHNEKQGTGLRSVEWADTMSHTALGWKAAPSMQTGRYALNSIYYSNWLFAVGGLDGINFLSSIEKAVLSPTTDEIIRWIETTPLSSPRANFAVAQHKNVVYVIGGTNSLGYYDSVEIAYFNEQGDLGFWGSKQQADEYKKRQSVSPARASISVSLPHGGVILDALESGSYTYIRVSKPDGDEWLAAGRADYKVGMTIRYSNGVLMPNFRSKQLNRVFSAIRFVSRVEILKP